MSATAMQVNDIRDSLNKADPNSLSDLAKAVKLGNQLSKVKVTVAALTATATPDITSAAVKAKITDLAGIALDDGENLPAIGQVVSLRVTAVGTAATGERVVTDKDGTAAGPHAAGAPGIALLSDDGKTLTFEGTVTGFVLTYIPAPAVGLDTAFPAAAP
jgi:hypothetical protein